MPHIHRTGQGKIKYMSKSLKQEMKISTRSRVHSGRYTMGLIDKTMGLKMIRWD